MKILATHTLYIPKENFDPKSFEPFIESIKLKGYFVQEYGIAKFFRIALNPVAKDNNIFIFYPKKADDKFASCIFFNIDHPGFIGGGGFSIGLLSPFSSLYSYAFLYGEKNYERIQSDKFCSEIFSELIHHLPVHRCPKCNSLSFRKEIWETVDKKFTEERIENALNAFGSILMGGHGAGGYWSEATKPRYRQTGYHLVCMQCKHSHTVTTEITKL